jgi:hypothetical protein
MARATSAPTTAVAPLYPAADFSQIDRCHPSAQYDVVAVERDRLARRRQRAESLLVLGVADHDDRHLEHQAEQPAGSDRVLTHPGQRDQPDEQQRRVDDGDDLRRARVAGDERGGQHARP